MFELIEKKGELVLRDEFKSCASRGYSDRRHPVDEHISHIRSKLGDSIIKTQRGKGYRLGPECIAELVENQPSTQIEEQLRIALDQIKDHSDPSYRAAILNCEEILKAKKIPEAYAALAMAYINRGHVGRCRELPLIACRKSMVVIDEAISRFPSFGHAYAIRGLAKLIYSYNWDGAEQDFKLSLDLSPENEYGHRCYAHLLVSQGKFDEAIAHAEKAARLAYDKPMAVITLPWFLYFCGNLGDAIVQGEKVVKLFGQCAPAHSLLGHAYCVAGAFEKAIEQYETALSIEFLPEVHASLGFLYGRCGKRRKALSHLSEICKAQDRGTIAYVSSYFAALVYTSLGRKRAALNALEKAFEERCDWLIHLAVEPRWSSLSREKRFRELIRRIGLRI